MFYAGCNNKAPGGWKSKLVRGCVGTNRRRCRLSAPLRLVAAASKAFSVKLFLSLWKTRSWKSSEMSIAMASLAGENESVFLKALKGRTGLFSNRTFSRKHDFPKTQENRWKGSQTVWNNRKKIINDDVFGRRRRELKRFSELVTRFPSTGKKLIIVLKRCLTCKVIGRHASVQVAGGFAQKRSDVRHTSLLNSFLCHGHYLQNLGLRNSLLY